MLWKIGAMVVLIAMLLLIALMVTINVDEVKTFDLSDIQAQQIVVGISNVINPNEVEASSIMDFTARPYELLMVGVKSSLSTKLTFLGLTADNKYYRTTESLSLGWFQNTKDIRIVDRTLIITHSKDWRIVSIYIGFAVIVLVAIIAFLTVDEATRKG